MQMRNNYKDGSLLTSARSFLNYILEWKKDHKLFQKNKCAGKLNYIKIRVYCVVANMEIKDIES